MPARTRAKRADSAPEPLLLSGPPDRVQATLALDNTRTSRTSVRGAVLRRTGATDVVAPLAVILAPGATARVPVSITLPPETPPGEFDAELEVGGVVRPVRVRVEESLRMTVSPARMLATAGDRAVSLLLTSRANVPIPVAAVSRAVSHDGTDGDGPDLTLTLDRGVVLPPGGSATVTGRLAVPAGLDPTRRHEAALPVGVADLTVLVLPRDGA